MVKPTVEWAPPDPLTAPPAEAFPEAVTVNPDPFSMTSAFKLELEKDVEAVSEKAWVGSKLENVTTSGELPSEISDAFTVAA